MDDVSERDARGWAVFLATIAFGFSVVIISEVSERLHRRRRRVRW